MAVFDLLGAMSGWGEARVNKLLRMSAVPANKTVGGLSERQRQALVSELSGERAARTERATNERTAP